MNKLTITILALTMMASFLSVSAGGGGSKNMDLFVKEFRKVKCKKWEPKHEVAEELVKSGCKKEAEKNSMCVSTCYYKQIGLLDEKYQLITNKKNLVAKMQKTGIYSKDLAEFLADVWVNSGCEKKLPKGGTSDCDKAKMGSMCLSLAANKSCGVSLDKIVSKAQAEM